ncbi:MAG: hypothetical protein R2849_04575 [Thermomicrobiales bacterium]
MVVSRNEFRTTGEVERDEQEIQERSTGRRFRWGRVTLASLLVHTVAFSILFGNPVVESVLFDPGSDRGGEGFESLEGGAISGDHTVWGVRRDRWPWR